MPNMGKTANPELIVKLRANIVLFMHVAMGQLIEIRAGHMVAMLFQTFPTAMMEDNNEPSSDQLSQHTDL